MDLVAVDDGRDVQTVGPEQQGRGRHAQVVDGAGELERHFDVGACQRFLRRIVDLEFDQESLFGRSDHFNFARHGVPIAFFFTGLHKDYHQPSDTPDKIHYEKLLRVATYVYDLAFELGVQDSRPAIEPKLWETFRGKAGKDQKPAAPMAAPQGR